MVPQLPVELVEQIISTTWHMPLSSQERITLMRSSVLVNSTWVTLFDHLASRDVYIPSSAYCDHFIQRLRTQPRPVTSYSFLGGFVRLFQKPLAPAAELQPANLACRSITIHIANPAVHPDQYNRTHLPMAVVLDELMEHIEAHGLAPHLCRLSIEYLNARFDDVFRRVGLAALPSQIEHLKLRYSFSADTPPWRTDALREKQKRQRHLGWAAQDVMHLSVFGAGRNTVQDLLRACPNIRTLDGESEDLTRFKIRDGHHFYVQVEQLTLGQRDFAAAVQSGLRHTFNSSKIQCYWHLNHPDAYPEALSLV